MEKVEYIELTHVRELMRLIKTRDQFHDWSDQWGVYDRKIKGNYEWILRNAKSMEKG